jgi:hypothetical protein
MGHEKPPALPSSRNTHPCYLKIQVNGCPGITRKPSSLLNDTLSNLSSLHTTGRLTSPQEIVSAVTLFFWGYTPLPEGHGYQNGCRIS